MDDYNEVEIPPSISKLFYQLLCSFNPASELFSPEPLKRLGFSFVKADGTFLGQSLLMWVEEFQTSDHQSIASDHHPPSTTTSSSSSSTSSSSFTTPSSYSATSSPPLRPDVFAQLALDLGIFHCTLGHHSFVDPQVFSPARTYTLFFLQHPFCVNVPRRASRPPPSPGLLSVRLQALLHDFLDAGLASPDLHYDLDAFYALPLFSQRWIWHLADLQHADLAAVPAPAALALLLNVYNALWLSSAAVGRSPEYRKRACVCIGGQQFTLEELLRFLRGQHRRDDPHFAVLPQALHADPALLHYALIRPRGPPLRAWAPVIFDKQLQQAMAEFHGEGDQHSTLSSSNPSSLNSNPSTLSTSNPSTSNASTSSSSSPPSSGSVTPSSSNPSFSSALTSFSASSVPHAVSAPLNMNISPSTSSSSLSSSTSSSSSLSSTSTSLSSTSFASNFASAPGEDEKPQGRMSSVFSRVDRSRHLRALLRRRKGTQASPEVQQPASIRRPQSGLHQSERERIQTEQVELHLLTITEHMRRLEFLPFSASFMQVHQQIGDALNLL